MRYDEDLGTLELSVRELAYVDQGPGLVASAFARLRTTLGRVVHHRIQAELPPGQTEVPLRLERSVDGVRCLILGRADVVRPIGDPIDNKSSPKTSCVVEEIKSVVALDDDDPELDDPQSTYASARRQVELYALALLDEGRPEVRAVLVLVEIEADRRRELDVPFDPAAVEQWLAEALRQRVMQARAEAERARARRDAAALLRFPHASLRPGQAELLEAIGEALANERPVVLSAPTGTGKTVVAMLPALREGLRRGASVWLLTAKTSQRQLAAQTFEAIVAASGISLHGVVTRRKEDMCPPGHLRCHPSLCPLLADFHERAGPVLDVLASEVLVRPEQLLEHGRAARLCPYELMHASIERADLVVADHSHVYDPRRSRVFEGRRLVIIDEAHNLVDRARAMASVFVPRHLPALQAAPALGESLVQSLAQLAAAVDDAIDVALQTAAAEERPAHEGRTTTSLDARSWQALGLEAGMLALRYAVIRLDRQDYEPRDPVLESLETIALLGELAGDRDPALVGVLAGPDAPGGSGIGVLCLDPARRLERLHRRQDGVIAMSATLEPVDYFVDVLGLARLEPAVIRAASHFPTEHRCVCIVPTVRTTQEQRELHAPAIAALVDEIIDIEPGNYAVFFSSFRYLGTVAAHLHRAALAKRGIDLLVQPPGANEAIRARFIERLVRGDRPTLLLAVSGGVFGEGIDLPNRALIGAIVVGPALPNLDFERRLMQGYYAERGLDPADGFAYAMAYPGMQRVVQAAGRVHRAPEDRGVIVLLGARFCEPPYCDAIPSHWYDYAPDELVTEEPAARLRRFWSNAREP